LIYRSSPPGGTGFIGDLRRDRPGPPADHGPPTTDHARLEAPTDAPAGDCRDGPGWRPGGPSGREADTPGPARDPRRPPHQTPIRTAQSTGARGQDREKRTTRKAGPDRCMQRWGRPSSSSPWITHGLVETGTGCRPVILSDFRPHPPRKDEPTTIACPAWTFVGLRDPPRIRARAGEHPGRFT